MFQHVTFRLKPSLLLYKDLTIFIGNIKYLISNMKTLKNSFVFIYMMLLLSACHWQDAEEVAPTQELKKLQVITLVQEPHLSAALARAGYGAAGTANSRYAGIQDLQAERILKVLQRDSSYIYTLALQPEDAIAKTFKNLVLREVKGGYLGFIIIYEAEEQFYFRADGSIDMDRFTGAIKRYDLESNLLFTLQFTDGAVVNQLRSHARASATCVISTKSFTVEDINCSDYNNIDGGPSTGTGIAYDYTAGVITYYTYGECDYGGGGTAIPGSDDGIDPNDPEFGTGSGSSSGEITPDPEPEEPVEEIAVLPLLPKISMLNELIYEKPFALYGNDVPCELVKQWVALAKFEVSPELKQKVQNIPGFYNSTGILNINNAYSSVVNMDYFSVKINTLPIINGRRATPNQFLEYIRLNIDQFVDPTLAQFTPYHSVLLGIDDRQLWSSNNALGAIVSITIPGDPGSVIVSRHNSSSWIFSTIKDPLNGTHPVSGNREFGYVYNTDGSYTFYTRGVDRLTDIWGAAYQSWDGTPFKNADALWTSFQNKVIAFANNPQNGGTSGAAIKGTTQTERPDWAKVRDVRDGKLPLTTLSNDCE